MLLTAPTDRVAAQHAADAIAAEPGCSVCHASHGSASTTLNLRLGDVQVWGAEGLGEISRSCLRCHSSAAMRARQPELVSGPATALRRPLLLGSDLSTQHPLGRRTSLLSMLEPGQPRSAGDPARVPPTIECSACHDPHARNETVPRPGSEAWICGSCHDQVSLAPAHEAQACSACHEMHGTVPNGRLMAGAEIDATCRSCHLTPRLDPQIRVDLRRASIAHMGGAGLPDGRCTECHAIHR